MKKDKLYSKQRVKGWLHQKPELKTIFCQAFCRDVEELLWFEVCGLFGATYVNHNKKNFEANKKNLLNSWAIGNTDLLSREIIYESSWMNLYADKMGFLPLLIDDGVIL